MITETDKSLELRRQGLQADLDAQKSGADRNRMGQFATPHALAVEIVQQMAAMLPSENFAIHFGDPAVGSGSFFSAALSVLGRQNIASAIGVEIDAAFCDAARRLWCNSGLTVEYGDFTRMLTNATPPSAPNVILANPPYVRHHHISQQDKQRLKRLALEKTGIKVSGLAGLYIYFVLLATAWLEDGGYAAWLIPAEFMEVNYGKALRNFLLTDVTLIRLHRFDPRDAQFDDAIVSSAVLFLKKSKPSVSRKVQFTFGGSLSNPGVVEMVDQSLLVHARKWTAYPREAGERQASWREVEGATLGDLFKIHRGVATGGNKVFILDREDAKKRGIPARFLRPILPSPRQLKATVIEAQSDGFPCLSEQLCLIDCDLPSPVLESRYPALWNYLHAPDTLHVRDGYLVGRRNPWYAQERREPSPFLCTYMGRGNDEKRPFRFIWNRSQAIATNLYLMLYPRRNLAVLLRMYPERAAEVFGILSQITGGELRSEGRVYGDGLHKIEPKELGRISAKPFLDRWPELSAEVSKQGELSLFG